MCEMGVGGYFRGLIDGINVLRRARVKVGIGRSSRFWIYKRPPVERGGEMLDFMDGWGLPVWAATPGWGDCVRAA